MHFLIFMPCWRQSHVVHLINPLITKQYLKANIRKCKTDKVDARLLARIGTMDGDTFPVYHASTEEVRMKKKVSLVHQLTKTKQQMKAALYQAQKTLAILGETSSSGMEVTANAVKELEKGIKELEKEIVEARRKDPMVKQLAEIPGISEQSAALVMTEIAGKTFDTKEKLTAFAGLDVSVRQSGSSLHGKGRLSKRGSPSLRRTLFLIAWGLKQHNEEFKKLYDYYRGKHKHYTAVLNILARKFLHVLFGMMKNQTPFNPDLIVLPS